MFWRGAYLLVKFKLVEQFLTYLDTEISKILNILYYSILLSICLTPENAKTHFSFFELKNCTELQHATQIKIIFNYIIFLLALEKNNFVW